MRKVKDLTGQKFGRWTVIKRGEDKIDKNGRHRTSWICKCECGNIKNVVSQALTSGDSKSCGCLQLEMTRLATEKDLSGPYKLAIGQSIPDIPGSDADDASISRIPI